MLACGTSPPPPPLPFAPRALTGMLCCHVMPCDGEAGECECEWVADACGVYVYVCTGEGVDDSELLVLSTIAYSCQSPPMLCFCCCWWCFCCSCGGGGGACWGGAEVGTEEDERSAGASLCNRERYCACFSACLSLPLFSLPPLLLLFLEAADGACAVVSASGASALCPSTRGGARTERALTGASGVLLFFGDTAT